MPSEKPARRPEDIIENAQAILRYTAGMDLEAFEEDRKTHDAVERCLERISEGATKLGDQAAELMPDQPWQKIRSLGNRLRHDYDDISQDRLWDIVQTDLPSITAACEDALRRLREGQGPVNIGVVPETDFRHYHNIGYARVSTLRCDKLERCG